MRRALLTLLGVLAAAEIFAGIILHGSGGAPPPGGDVTEVGVPTYWCSNATAGNNPITIVPNADLLVFTQSGWPGRGADYFLGSSVQLCDAADCSGTSQPFTVAADYDNTTNQQAVVWQIASPNVGSQFIVWDSGNPDVPSEGINFRALQYENVSSIDADVGKETGPFSVDITSSPGNLILCFGDTYIPGPMNWTGATEQASDTCNSNVGEYATNDLGAAATVSLASVDGTYTVLVCINIAN